MGAARAIGIGLLVVALVAGCSGDDDDGGKSVDADDLKERDALVTGDVGTDDDLRAVLDDDDDVVAYVELAPGVGPALRASPETNARCRGGAGFVVDVEDGADLDALASRLGEESDVEPLPPPPDPDMPEVEIFMDVNAPREAIDAVAARLAEDEDVESFEHLDKEAAFEEFNQIFAGQPSLREGVTPEILPENFKVHLVRGAELAAMYAEMDSVNNVLLAEDRPEFTAQDRLERALALDETYEIPRTGEVFMHVDANRSQVAAVEEALRDDPDIVDVEYRSKDDAYEEYRRIFAGRPDVVESTDPEDLPESFRFEYTADADPDALQRYESLAGVDEVLFTCT